MTLSRHPALPALLPLLLWAIQCGAANNFVLDPEHAPSSIQEGAPRQEGSVTLPPWPRDADLIAFVPDGAQPGFKYFIDGKHLSIDAPFSAVRYTLVIESPSGARNLSYEGIRCTLKGAYRVYAYGTDGRFVTVAGGDWLPIQRDAINAYREDLRANRFCVPRETRPRPLNDMVRALHGHGSPRDNTGFQAN
jgi:hypothetical protein